MKKSLILFIMLSTMSVTANTDSFYERVYSMQNQGGGSFSHPARRVVVQHTPRKIYRSHTHSSQIHPQRIIRRTPIHKLRTSPVVRLPQARSSVINSKKFFYATRAAKNGNAKAQFDLAIMYATGRGVAKNEKLAFNWFHKSARKNYAPAKHYMGISFLQGRGVRKQKELARYWFKLASKQGYKSSSRYLSQLDRSLANRG